MPNNEYPTISEKTVKVLFLDVVRKWLVSMVQYLKCMKCVEYIEHCEIPGPKICLESILYTELCVVLCSSTGWANQL